MRGARISIRGLYIYDNTIFDNLVLPDGMDKTTLIGDIMMECAELECIFPDPDTIKEAIGYWSTSRGNAWNRLYQAMTADYNPIYNKDGYVEESSNMTGNNVTSGTGSSTGSVAGMNSSTLNPAEKTDSTSGGTSETEQNVENLRHEYGNIGVTTSQQMLREEVELRSELDVYGMITDEFKRKFCLLVY